MTRGLIVLVTAATMGAAILPAPAQAGGNGGAVAAGVIGGLAVGGMLGAAAAQPRYYAPGAGLCRSAAAVLLLDPRRAGVGRLSRRVGAAARAGLRLTDAQRLPRIEAPARLARAFLFDSEAVLRAPAFPL